MTIEARENAEVLEFGDGVPVVERVVERAALREAVAAELVRAASQYRR